MHTSAKAIQRQMYEDVLWARVNDELREKYPGQLVVIHKKQFLRAGHNRQKLLNEAASAEHPREELVIITILSDDYEIPPDTHV